MADTSKADNTETGELRTTPLAAWHGAQGARMVPFAGYSMPVQYPSGIMAEHLWTREKAGLFDVSHMGQCFVISDSWERTARALEALVPADILNLRPGQQRYSQLLAEDGGILDDLMITRPAYPGFDGYAYLVVNAGCKEQDYAHLRARLPAGVRLELEDEMALVALQGPAAADILGAIVPGIGALPFMMSHAALVEGVHLHVSRSGYTGEDGFEIAVPDAHVVAFCDRLMADARVRPVGLGARDSLRLEAGLCLYGHDIDPTTSPVEADLTWSIQKRRREAGGFPGAARIQRELRERPARLRVGIRPEGRQPAREGTEILVGGRPVGRITSGGFGPSANAPVAMGYVEAAFARPDTPVTLIVRGRELQAHIAAMPFVPHRYFR
ncbi:glycine cleavage system aminomethyltransferase GcvT [Rhabdaerophilum calidifontis]|uniref:glycine cleavage system aminomethyltransferase GcvT n=1 Tax=Rhabdaerophilum calidifontis TaxID=2604328 RepID=UPI0012388385|nr:glycine cleavage system aminomethyltransferase GcvT [Rhabdaerophilum calidifontis]